MGTFFKTFFCCLIIALSFLMYKFLKSESYDTNLQVNNENPVYAKYDKYSDLSKNNQNKLQENSKNDIDSKTPNSEDKTNSNKEKFEYVCYFYTATGKLVSVKREFSIKQSLENTISMLLSGPTIKETKEGIYTEIPKNVELISVKETPDSVIVNLSAAFGQGGGSQSIENRVSQLSKTVKNRVKNKKVYLYIDNKEVEYLGGEGIYIAQPLK